MVLQSIGTNSEGNCYILSHGCDMLLLDAGVPIDSIYKAIGFNLSAIDACLISHIHSDHALSAKKLYDAFVTIDTHEEIALDLDMYEKYASFHDDKNVYGNWMVEKTLLEHDVVTMGFYIHHIETKQNILYITDTGYIKISPVGVNILIVECNFVEAMIHVEEMEDRFKRVKSSHMSLERLVSWLKKIDRSQLTHIVLIHLSDSNSDEKLMVDTIKQLTGVQVSAARNGETINLDVVPF